MTRIETLRHRLAWSQPKLSTYLGCSQSTVSRLENGQPEPGPIAKLLDLLEAEAPPSSEPASGVEASPVEGG